MSVFSKLAAPFNRARYLNTANLNDSTIGGTITGSPPALTPGATGSSYYQNFPGDRFLFGPMDANSISNNAVGNLYVGSYRYVQFRNNSTSNALLGCGGFWDPTVGGNLTGNNISNNGPADAQFMVTTDGNAANYTNIFLAGVCINNITFNNGTAAYWFIQESGKASVKMRLALTGTAAIGAGVYSLITPAANNNATDNGAFDILNNTTFALPSANNVSYNNIDSVLNKYIGPAETLATNNNICIVDMHMWRSSYRMTAA